MRKSWLIAFLIMSLYTAALVVFVYSWGYSGTLSGDGVSLAFGQLFGGLPSLGESLIGIVVFIGVVLIIWVLADNDLNGWAAAVAGVALFLALYALDGNLTMPSGQIGALIALLVVSAVMTALMAKVLAHRTGSSTTTASTSPSLWNKFQSRRRAHATRVANGGNTQTTTTTTP